MIRPWIRKLLGIGPLSSAVSVTTNSTITTQIQAVRYGTSEPECPVSAGHSSRILPSLTPIESGWKHMSRIRVTIQDQADQAATQASLCKICGQGFVSANDGLRIEGQGYAHVECLIGTTRAVLIFLNEEWTSSLAGDMIRIIGETIRHTAIHFAGRDRDGSGD